MLDIHRDAHEATEDGAAADDGEPARAELVAALARVGGPDDAIRRDARRVGGAAEEGAHGLAVALGAEGDWIGLGFKG